ncbi:hypothetical protein RFI_36263 [Reticulomyxa filosa]|uniref:Uncharacterized protein n=1 Tax=Reticulomyxa filosa TaxID=46433 RepID=X6LJ41_RETFI|nr:hypothetical protein RFI_36263 [Reticulomyxa filosa]|eukprot:ETO01177.1 hypothetical protein RFI_36263 [Reticulomyxa filosa]
MESDGCENDVLNDNEVLHGTLIGFWKAFIRDNSKEEKNQFLMKNVETIMEGLTGSLMHPTSKGTLSGCMSNEHINTGTVYPDLMWAEDSNTGYKGEPERPFIVIDYKLPRILTIFDNNEHVLQKTWTNGCADLCKLIIQKKNESSKKKKTKKIRNTDKGNNNKMPDKNESAAQNQLYERDIALTCNDKRKLASILKKDAKKELDWHSYTLQGLKRYCENLNVAASDDKDDMIKKLQIVQPRCIMNAAPLVNIILQISGYMIWSGARVGMIIGYPNCLWLEADKINKDDKIFNIKVYKMLKMESFKDAMLELVRITKYAKTLAPNEKILREKKGNKRNFSTLKSEEKTEESDLFCDGGQCKRKRL